MSTTVTSRNANDEALIKKAERWGREALGKTMTVRLAKHRQMDAVRMVTGPIVEAHFSHFVYTAARQRVVWKVVIEAGVSKTRHIVHIQRLPR